MPSNKSFKCLHCRELHPCDRRNRGRQHFCAKPGCRKASKAASQRRWAAKEENRDYFRGSDNVEWLRRWRAAHPGYWRKKRPRQQDALQEDIAASARVFQSRGEDILRMGRGISPARERGRSQVHRRTPAQHDGGAFVIDYQTRCEIRHLHQREGLNFQQIGRTLGIDPETASKHARKDFMFQLTKKEFEA